MQILRPKPILPPVDQTTPCRIALGHGRFAIVDAQDFDRINRYKWRLKQSAYRSYAIRNTKRNGIEVTLYMHREVVRCAPGFEVHHINGDTLDNRRQNLLIVTRAEHDSLHFKATA